MDWKRISEQVVTAIIAGLLLAFGGAVVWAVKVILDHERTLVRQEATNEIVDEQMAEAKSRDKEMLALLAGELKQLQEAVDLRQAEPEPEPTTPAPTPAVTFPMPPVPASNKATRTLFPEQTTEDYQRILRDKFHQRTQEKYKK